MILIRYERSKDQYCFTENGFQITPSQSKFAEYFFVGGGITSAKTKLNNAVIYDSDWGVTDLPELPFSGDDIKENNLDSPIQFVSD